MDSQARISETREVVNFNRVELCDTTNWVTLIVRPGEREALEIEGPPEVLGRIQAQVKDGTLIIDLGGGITQRVKDALTTSLTRRSITYHLTARHLIEVVVTGLVTVDLDAYGEDRPEIRVKPMIPGMPKPPRPIA